MAYVSEAELANLCRQLRESAGLSQTALARELGISRQYMSYAEDPTETSRHGIRERILAHFGYDLEQVYRVTKKSRRVNKNC